jgi:hypothetical protein
MKTWSIIWAALTLTALIGLLIGNKWMLFVTIICGILTVACLVESDEQRDTQEE